MKVAELIELLQELDPELEVVVDGYEGGLAEVTEATTLKVIRDHNSEDPWYYGPHEQEGTWNSEERKADCQMVLVASSDSYIVGREVA